jgi:hypothetical protein
LDIYPAEFLEGCTSNETVLSPTQEDGDLHLLQSAKTDSLESNKILFETLLQAIPKLSPKQLLDLEGAIQTAKALYWGS